MSDEELLAEQRLFYRRRAPEYDEWWQRRGRYDRGEAEAAEWRAQVDTVAEALSRFGPRGDVVELAGGTGWWTQRLADGADTLTVVDASPEALVMNRRRVGRHDVGYVVADVFGWPLRATHDVVFFSFWLSHVPRARFGAFWVLVGSQLRANGRVFFVDNRLDPTRVGFDPYVIDDGADVQRRRLGDGSEHRVVKVFYEPTELADLLSRQGWRAQVHGTRWFIYGSARPL